MSSKKFFLIQNILLTIFSVMTIITSIMLIIVIFVLPLPERFLVSQLDYIMILMGQKTSLILIYVFASLAISFIIITWIFSWILYSKSFMYPTNWFLSWYVNKKVNNKPWYIYIYILFITLLVNILAPFSFWLHWICYKYINKKEYFKNQIIIEKNVWFNWSKNYSINKKKFIKFLIILLLPLTILFVVNIVIIESAIIVNNSYIEYNNSSGKFKNKYWNINNSKNFMTLSNNNVNTIMYYFDRGQGILFNSLIYYDYLLNGNKSLMKMFPEFTSYIQSVSTSSTTNGTNPSIISSIFYSPLTKNLNVLNPYTNEKYNMEQIKDTWTDALVNQANMFFENDTKYFKVSSIPYISTNYTGSIYGDTKWIEQSLSDKTNSEFASTTNESIAFTMNHFKDMNRTSDAVVWKNGSQNYQFENTNSGVYQGWYMHFTHESYAYYDYDNDKYYSSLNSSNHPLDFLKSTWFAIQELKNNLIRLKNEPFYNQNNECIGNVYDHSQIIIISDHGYSLYDNNFEIRKLMQYVAKKSKIDFDNERLNKFIDNYVRKNNNEENLKNNSLFAFNNILMYKPFKNTYPEIDNQKLFTFNTNTIITSSDVQLFLEAGLKRYKAIKENKTMNNFDIFQSSFFNKKIEGNSKLINWINNYLVYDPLVNSEALKKRKIILLNFKNWRFTPNSTTNEIFSCWWNSKELELSVKNSIFNTNNFSLFLNKKNQI